MSATSPLQILSFYRSAEKLKTTLRHSWLSNPDRRESVAEHTWMMMLLAMTIMPHLKQKLDQAKVLRMIVLHDLAEAVTTDLPVWEGIQDKAAKVVAERQAMEKIFAPLDEETRADFMMLWEEYEQRTSPEALFVKTIDTLDVVSQHNTAPIETWDDNDYFWQISAIQDAFFNIDPYLRSIKNELDRWSITKVKAVGKLEKLDQEELKKKKITQ